MDWKDIAWIKSLAPGVPVVIKGIGAWEVSRLTADSDRLCRRYVRRAPHTAADHQDAELARAHGADGIVLSNHGGRALD